MSKNIKNIYNEDTTSNKQYNFENSDEESDYDSIIDYEEQKIYYEDTIHFIYSDLKNFIDEKSLPIAETMTILLLKKYIDKLNIDN